MRIGSDPTLELGRRGAHLPPPAATAAESSVPRGGAPGSQTRARSAPCETELTDGSRQHQPCDFRSHATSAPAELGGEIHNLLRNRARRSFCRHGSCTFTEVARLVPSGGSTDFEGLPGMRRQRGTVATPKSANAQPKALLSDGACQTWPSPPLYLLCSRSGLSCSMPCLRARDVYI